MASPRSELGSDEQAEAAGVATPVTIAPTGPQTLTLASPELYINRELSLLEFQKRVLQEAQDPENPLLERVKFLSIVSSNLDEFFMVRVAGLQKQAASGTQEASVDGLPAAIQLQRIREEVRRLVQVIQDLLRDTLLPALQRQGIRILGISSLTQEERSAMDSYFLETVFPVLTPLAFDPGRPFPHISSGSLNLAVVVGDNQGTEHFARVKVPDSLPRLVLVETDHQHKKVSTSLKSEMKFVWLEQLIIANLHLLFPGMEIVEAHPFRVTRDAEVAIQELESDDLLETVEEAIWQRRFRAVVRLQVAQDIPDHILQILVENLESDRRDVYYTDGALDLSRVKQILSIERSDLKDPPFLATTPPELNPKAEEDVFAVLRRDDVLLHHPYESFQPIVEFLRRAASDPDVLAIKITLYRVGRNSPVVEALLNAIENGKQV